MTTVKDNSKMNPSARVSRVQQAREDKMMSKAELARKAGVTVQTIDRIERGYECRLATKRKIILALGYQLADRSKVFESRAAQEEQENAERASADDKDAPGNIVSARSGEQQRVRVFRKKVRVTQ